MGNIQKIDTKKYRIRVEAGIDPSTGNRKRLSKTIYGTKQQAMKVLAKMEKNKNTDYHKGNELKLKDYLNKWIKNYSSNIAQSTTKDYISIIENHLIPSLGELKLNEINYGHIIEYQNQKLKNGNLKTGKGLSNRSVQAHHRLLSLALKQAVNLYELIEKNPCDPVQAPTPNKNSGKSLSREDASLILNSIEDILLYTIFFVALYTGMRRSEITGLKWKDINFNNKTISVRRSGGIINGEFSYKKLKNDSSRRQVAMSNSLIKELKKFKAKRGAFAAKESAVFLTPDGKPVKPDYLTSKFKSIFKQLEMPEYKFHDLRHTHATWLLEEGINPKIVQKRLGHSRIETTLDIYSHVSLNEQRKAAEKFDVTL